MGLTIKCNKNEKRFSFYDDWFGHTITLIEAIISFLNNEGVDATPFLNGVKYPSVYIITPQDYEDFSFDALGKWISKDVKVFTSDDAENLLLELKYIIPYIPKDYEYFTTKSDYEKYRMFPPNDEEYEMVPDYYALLKESVKTKSPITLSID